MGTANVPATTRCSCSIRLVFWNMRCFVVATTPARGSGDALLPVMERYGHLDIPRFFRGDAAFAVPKLMRVLEDVSNLDAIRIKANAAPKRAIEHLLTRPMVRPSYKPKVFYRSFHYHAKSWQRERRVVAKIEWHAGGVLPSCGVHCNQPHKAFEERREILQRSWHSRAVDQGREERGQVDEALLSHVQVQLDASVDTRAGLQIGELLAENGFAKRD